MKTKLTLSIEENLVQFAHQEAKRTGKSVSALFSESIRRRQTSDRKKLTAQDMYGIFAGTTVDDSKEGIASAYADKYLP